MAKHPLERCFELLAAQLAASPQAPAAMYVVAAFVDHGVCVHIWSEIVAWKPGMWPPESLSQAWSDWASLASRIQLSFGWPEAGREYSAGALLSSDRFATVAHFKLGGRDVLLVPPLHQAHRLASLIQQHPEAAAELCGTRVEARLAPAISFLVCGSRVTALDTYRARVLRRARLGDSYRLLDHVCRRLRAWAERGAGREEDASTLANARTDDSAALLASSPSGDLAADAANLCRYLCAVDAGRHRNSEASNREIGEAIEKSLPLMSRAMAAFGTTAALRTGDSIGYLLRAAASFHRLGLESMTPELAQRIASWLRPLLAELHELQLGSPVYDFHHEAFLPAHRGAIRRSRLDERIDAPASMRCLAALLSLQDET